MPPSDPGADSFAVPDGAVGLNLSPLFGRHVLGANYSITKVDAAVRTDDRRPLSRCWPTDRAGSACHATGNDDHALMSAAADALPADVANLVTCAPRGLDAQQTKSVISRCAVFAGARTHSTIAGLSSCVPTLTLAYSTKGTGIPMDVYGHTDYCITSDAFSPDLVAGRVAELVARRDQVAESLGAKLPSLLARAYSAGELLRDSLELDVRTQCQC